MGGGVASSAEDRVLVFVSKVDDAFIVDATINAPVKLQVAWDVFTDFDHMPEFLSNLTSSQVVKRDRNLQLIKQAGVAKIGIFSFQFQSEREIRLEPMHWIFSKSLSGVAKRMESVTELKSSDQGVHVKYHAEVVPDSVIARIFGAPFMRREVEEQFNLMLTEMKRRESPDGASARPAK